MQPPNVEEVRAQLAKIVGAAVFKDANRARRFLTFIVEEALAGNGAELKENVVGISVFDRAADYDPRLDSIVRVEAGRLRAKLQEYYSQEGRDDAIIFDLPKGGYAPSFVQREKRPSAEPEELSAVDKLNDSPAPVANGRRSIWRRHRLALVAGLALAAVIALTAWREQNSEPELRIAILPFTPYSDNANERLVADRLTQKVTAEFVKLRSYNVVPSTSARRYESQRPAVREIAAALQADLLLEARTTADAGGVKVEVRLSDGALDRKFWVSDKFAGENIDALATEIAAAASRAVSTRRPSKKISK